MGAAQVRSASSVDIAKVQLVACHSTDTPDGVIPRTGNSVFCKNPRVVRFLLERTATKRDKEYHE
jgi:hypothetical protein